MFIRANQETLDALTELAESLHTMSKTLSDAFETFDSEICKTQGDLGTTQWYFKFSTLADEINNVVEDGKDSIEKAGDTIEEVAGMIDKLVNG